jgi:hypothetical protein
VLPMLTSGRHSGAMMHALANPCMNRSGAQRGTAEPDETQHGANKADR